MRLALLTRSLEYGGAERQLVALATGLRARGHAVVVLSFYPGGPLAAELAAADVRVHDLDKGGRWNLLGFARRLLDALRAERCDILHTYLQVPNIIGTLAPLALPGLRLVWGLRASHLELVGFDWLSRWSFAIERSLASRPDGIIVNSNAGREHAVARGYPGERMHVVHNGIDVDRFQPDPEARTRIRAELGVEPAQPLIGLVGRIDPGKGHAHFLTAAAAVRRVRPATRFVCVGDGWLELARSLRARAGELGLDAALDWLPARRDVPAVMAALDVFCSASLGEGFPNVVAEAMACGTKCVVTDVGDSATIVGDRGSVVPVNDPAALAAGLLEQLVRDPAAAGAAARGRIVERFSVARMVEASEAVLADVLS